MTVLELLMQYTYKCMTIEETDRAIKKAVVEELLSKWPEKMYDPKKTCQPDYPDDYTKGKVYGTNQTLNQTRKILEDWAE